MEKLLSIIVPVYKVEAYINKCLDSLVMDDIKLMNKLEVIIVNDGTPDRSAEMSREYVKRYPGTFRQIDKENGGHGSAWNVGLSEATGKYIRFLDSDDWLTNLNLLIKDLAVCDADIVFNPCYKEYIYEGRTDIIPSPVSHSGVTHISSELLNSSKWPYDSAHFWNCTYKTNILTPLQPIFAEKTMYDDFILTWVSLVYGRTYSSLDYPVYHYFLGRPGQTLSYTRQRKGAESFCKCFDQYEIVRSRIDSSIIPEDILCCIDSFIANYAHYIFPFATCLPYRDAKTRMQYFWANYLHCYNHKSHLEKRYEKLPFGVFYFVEFFRREIYSKLRK